MAKLTTDGMEEFIRTLNALGEKAGGVAKKCAYDGAKILREEIAAGVRALPLDEDGFRKGSDPLKMITEADRNDLENCLGVSRIESDGLVTSVSVSFDGYIRRTEDKYPKGVPAIMIARSIESGSSVRAKKPFVRPAVNKARERVLSAMQETMSDSIQQIQKLEG